MSSAPIPDSLLTSLDVLLLEREGAHAFRLVGDAPSWAYRLWPDAVSRRNTLDPAATFFFIDHFMEEAAEVWQDDQDRTLTSEMWTEVDATGREWLLEAQALRLGGRALLLLKPPTVAPENLREVLQQSRELNLEHYRILKEIDRREVMMHCLIHDLSTPLAAIKGSLRTLQDEAMVVDDGTPLIHIGLRQVEKLRAMLREMLTGFKTQTASQPPANPLDVPDLAAAVQDLTTGLAPTAHLKNVRFRVETTPQTGTAWGVVGETARLERVLFNLFENALRYAPSGTEVMIRLVDEGPTIYARIEDAGEGVPGQEVDRLFRKFAQGSGAAGQVGLGLYFCRITIEGWGGHIGYEPSAQGGACFWFRLPKPTPDPA